MRRSVAYCLSLAVLAGAMLHFTLPRYRAAPGEPCAVGAVPLTDLALVRLYGAYPGEWPALWSEHAAGQPGAPDSFAVTWDGLRPLSLWVATTDNRGNESCRAAEQLGGGVAVEPAPPLEGVRWYDVAGRMVHVPTAPGVYYWRSKTGRHGSRIVLR